MICVMTRDPDDGKLPIYRPDGSSICLYALNLSYTTVASFEYPLFNVYLVDWLMAKYYCET